MDDYNRGLMASEAAKLTKRGPLLEQFMQSLSTLNGQAQTLEQRLAEMSDRERSMLLQTSKFVQMAMRMKIAASDYSMGYPELIQSMYGQMSITKRSLLAELLDETNPLDFIPKPKQSRQDMTMALYERPHMQVTPQEPSTAADDQAADTMESVLADAFSDTATASQAQQKQATTFQSKDDFLAAMTPAAKTIADELGVSHKIILAQAALESAWGAKAKGNAFFGIKSHGKAGGQTFTTHEEINGERVKITDSFRRYDTPEDSIRGYRDFLKSNPRYRYFLAAGQDNEDAQLMALQESGYATDSNYAQKLKAIMKGLPDEAGT